MLKRVLSLAIAPCAARWGSTRAARMLALGAAALLLGVTLFLTSSVLA